MSNLEQFSARTMRILISAVFGNTSGDKPLIAPRCRVTIHRNQFKASIT
jgi:hypothetical protein